MSPHTTEESSHARSVIESNFPSAAKDKEQINTVIKYLGEGYDIHKYDPENEMFHMKFNQLDIAVLRGGIAISMGSLR